MNLTGGIVLYAVVWFLVFFIVLPIRETSQAEAGEVVPGTPEGAPADPRIRRKAIITTVIATVIWGALAWIILSGAISIRDLDFFGRMDQR